MEIIQKDIAVMEKSKVGETIHAAVKEHSAE